MKVVCESCSAAFKVKGEVPAGKAFKFKCPKCKHVNRIHTGDLEPGPAKAKVNCEDCGTQIIETPEDEPRLCDQCRASRAVKEAQKLRIQAEESPLPEGVEFPEELFSPDEEAPAAVSEEPPMPSEIEEPPEPAPETAPETAPEPIAEFAEDEPVSEPTPEAPGEFAEEEPVSEPASKAVGEFAEEESAPELLEPPSESMDEAASEVEQADTAPAEEAVEEGKEEVEAPDEGLREEGKEEEEEEEVLIGAPPPEQKPATPESAYRIRSSDGLIIGPIKLVTLRDLIVAKKVHSDEDFSRDEGQYMSMAEFPELFEIFESESVKKAEQEEEEIVEDDLERVRMSRDKILSMLKVKKNCVGCGEEIFVIEDIPNPLCDQCRIEALVAKKREAQQSGEAVFRVRSPDGLVLGPLRRSTVEDLVAANNIRGVEEVSVDDGPWRPIIEVEELADLFDEPVEDIIDLTEIADG